MLKIDHRNDSAHAAAVYAEDVAFLRALGLGLRLREFLYLRFRCGTSE